MTRSRHLTKVRKKIQLGLIGLLILIKLLICDFLKNDFFKEKLTTKIHGVGLAYYTKRIPPIGFFKKFNGLYKNNHALFTNIYKKYKIFTKYLKSLKKLIKYLKIHRIIKVSRKIQY